MNKDGLKLSVTWYLLFSELTVPGHSHTVNNCSNNNIGVVSDHADNASNAQTIPA